MTGDEKYLKILTRRRDRMVRAYAREAKNYPSLAYPRWEVVQRLNEEIATVEARSGIDNSKSNA